MTKQICSKCFASPQCECTRPPRSATIPYELDEATNIASIKITTEAMGDLATLASRCDFRLSFVERSTPATSDANVYVLHGVYAPESYIEGVYKSSEAAEQAQSEQDEPNRYEVVQKRVW